MSGTPSIPWRVLMVGAASALALSACGPKAADHDAGGMEHDAMAPAAATSPGPAAATIGALTISSPVAHPPQGGQTTAVAYLSIHNGGAAPDRLLAASSSAASPVELHTHSMDGGVMKMQKVDAIDIPANGEVTLAPGGYHLMLFNFAAKDPQIVVHLRFEKAGEVDVPMPVEMDASH